MVDVVVVVSLEMEADTAMWSCDAFLVLVAGECALGLRLRKEVSFRRLLIANGLIMIGQGKKTRLMFSTDAKSRKSVNHCTMVSHYSTWFAL